MGSGSLFNLAAGNMLIINGGTADFKSYTPNASQLTFTAGSLSYAGNLLVGAGGLLGTDLTLFSDRQLSLTGAATVDIARTLTVYGGSLTSGSLVNNGTVVVNSGTLSTQTATFASGGTLQINIGGTTRNNQYGALGVSGNLALSGALRVSLINPFVPAAGNSFDILDWSPVPGSLSGAFTSMLLPTLTAGLTWNTSQLYVTGIISVSGSAAVVGDYNFDGVVDAADYAIWRATLGSTADLRANGDNTGTSAGKIDQADFNVWKVNFGMHAGSGSGAARMRPCPSRRLCFC